MEEINDIYTDLVMEHSMNSYNKKHIDCPTCSLKAHNPNCGDEITLSLVTENGVIKDMAFSGYGCAISQSSTSIMIDTLKGQTIEKAKQIIDIYLRMIKREEISNEEKRLLKDSIAFENIANMPARVKCATLAWHTLDDMLNGKTEN